MASWFDLDTLQDQADILFNVAKSVVPMEKLLTGLAYLIGVAFITKGVFKLKIYGESRTMMSSSASAKEPLTFIVIGAVFLFFPSAFGTLHYTMFGYDNPLAFAPIDSHNQTISTLFGPDSLFARPLAEIIQLIGLIAFIRGWILIARSATQGQQPGGTGKGLMHVVGGILAMNIIGTMQIINTTLFGS
jgi:intracellular multiplication protein IcmC